MYLPFNIQADSSSRFFGRMSNIVSCLLFFGQYESKLLTECKISAPKRSQQLVDIFTPDTGWGWLYSMVLKAHWARGSVVSRNNYYCSTTKHISWGMDTHTHDWSRYYICADKYVCLRIFPRQIALSWVSTWYATPKLSMCVFQNHTKLLAFKFLSWGLLLEHPKVRHLLQQRLSYLWEDNFRLH